MNDDPKVPELLPLYDYITKTIHAAVAAGDLGLLQKRNIDSLVHEMSKGTIPTYSALLQAQKTHASAISQKEMSEAGDPGAMATAAGRGLTGMTFGLAPKIMGAFSPEMRQTFEEGMGRGSEEHPMAGFLGEEGGGLASGILGGSLIGKALPFQAMKPGLRAAAQGGIFGAGIGEAQGIAAQPGQEFDPVAALPGAGLGLLTGAVAGATGEKLLSRYNATPDVLHEAVQASSAVRPGVLSAGVGFKEGMKELERSSKLLAGQSSTLQRPMAMLTRKFRILTLQQARKSPAAADDAIATLQGAKDMVKQEYASIAQHPTTGYDAILNKVDIAQDPRVIAIAQETGQPIGQGARWLEDLKQQVRGDVRVLQRQKETGAEKVKNVVLKNKGELLGRLDDVLNDVPGYATLNATVSPYLKYMRDADAMLVQLGRARARGMSMAGGSLHEALPEAIMSGLGLSKTLGTERTARGVVGALTRAKDPHSLLQMGELSPPFSMTEPRIAGASAGLLSPLIRHLMTPSP